MVARRPGGRRGGVSILDAAAVADFPQHLHVVSRALTEAERFQLFALGFELAQPLLQFGLYIAQHPFHDALLGDEVSGGIHGHAAQPSHHAVGDGVHLHDLLYLVTPQAHADGQILVGGPDLKGVAPHAELAPGEAHVVALVLDGHQALQHFVPVHLGAFTQQNHLGQILFRRTQAVDAGDRGHNHHIVAGEEATGGRVAQAIDLLVDGGVLLDVGVRGGDVGLGLVVVVVGDEILHGVLGQELAELVAELSRQRLVVGDHQGGFAHRRDEIGHGKGLAGAGHAQQCLKAISPAHALNQSRDGFGLISPGYVVGFYAKLGHCRHLTCRSTPTHSRLRSYRSG